MILSKYDLNVPLHACEHYYVLTDNIDGVDPLLPLFRDFDARCYIRPTVGTRWHEDFAKESSLKLHIISCYKKTDVRLKFTECPASSSIFSNIEVVSFAI